MAGAWAALRPTAAFAQASAADQSGPVESITVGHNIAQATHTKTLPADISPVFIGNTVESAGAVAIDSSQFPGRIAIRRFLGMPDDPQFVTTGPQLSYLDFRGYSGGRFYNAGSLDMVVDPLAPFAEGELMPSTMRFAVSDGQQVFIPMNCFRTGA